MSGTEQFLHIGDSITIYDDVSDGFLGAQGIASVQVGVRAVVDPLHAKLVGKEAIFMLRQQHNYSVFRQMRNFLEREGLSEQEANSDTRYRELLDAREREKATNMQEFANTRGREVRYGMIVQMQHKSTHKFLSVARQNAVTNTDARRVVLDGDAGEDGADGVGASRAE